MNGHRGLNRTFTAAKSLPELNSQLSPTAEKPGRTAPVLCEVLSDTKFDV